MSRTQCSITNKLHNFVINRYMSYIHFNNDKQNLKKFANFNSVHLKKNEITNKTEIFINDKILLTNKKNVFALECYDLCFLIKLEFLRNRHELILSEMPLTVCANNLIDFLFMQKRGNYDLLNIDSYEDRSIISNINNTNTETEQDINNCLSIERLAVVNKVYQTFQTDLIFYQNKETGMGMGMGMGMGTEVGTEEGMGIGMGTGTFNCELKKKKNSKDNTSELFVNLPYSLNYIEIDKITNLQKEESNVYNKHIKLFEKIHQIKLNNAKNFEIPEQDINVQEKIKNLIKNMNSSELFIFYQCTQVLNSFIYTYLFLNGYINYKQVYRYCNLEYMYQFITWGYVYDINSVKDSNALLTLCSLYLVNKLINTQKNKKKSNI
ncbi:ATP synthase mitochondrial F1 complex assembly factor 2, putative [Hepatocystis sp. ex Piliocolobus tephrosceles]|nr:ATP synthase mitochondrial F1 complex assembly factor 2, putative [Hepatocystis sp. ex Piliocolobus tephrosceles]